MLQGKIPRAATKTQRRQKINKYLKKNICPHKNLYINVHNHIIHLIGKKWKQPNVHKLMNR